MKWGQVSVCERDMIDGILRVSKGEKDPKNMRDKGTAEREGFAVDG
jgi:hypothetical protein